MGRKRSIACGARLEPYLAAASAETTTLDAAALAELNEKWSITHASERQSLTAAKPWSAIKFDKHPQAEFIDGTGQLVVERRVGRGRVVVTAFHLGEPELLKWRSFDSFFNGCLLGARRAVRQHAKRVQLCERSRRRAITGSIPRRRPACAFTRDSADPDQQQTKKWLTPQEETAQ